MTNHLDEAIEQAYTVFQKYSIQGKLIHCDCPVCMAEETAFKLSTLPLRVIPSEVLAEYTNSAHEYDNPIVHDQLRYFLPRYLELMAQGNAAHHYEPAQCLSKLKETDYREKWPQAKIDCIDHFFQALLQDALAKVNLQRWRDARWDENWILSDTTSYIIDIMVFCQESGADMERFISYWLKAPDPTAALLMAAILLGDDEDDCRKFLSSDAVTQKIEQAFFTKGLHPRLQQYLSDAIK